MQFEVSIKMNEKLFLRDPQSSVLGKSIVKEALALINELGFEEFTFKKLAQHTKTTEASIYRYFENKHKLLVYLIAWYWSYMEYKIVFGIQNIKSPEEKLRLIVNLLVNPEKIKISNQQLDEKKLNKLVVEEGSKSYLTKHIIEENRDKLFKPYKDLCGLFSSIIVEYAPSFKFPQSLATTILETSHSHKFYSANLPSLSNIKSGDNKKFVEYLEIVIFSALK
ncbi:MAG: TetR/AcrR family transcriptional regulator [Bacteroidia bacterium]